MRARKRSFGSRRPNPCCVRCSERKTPAGFRELYRNEFPPLGEAFVDETDGEETKTKKLRQEQRIFLKGKLFELERLSSPAPKPEADSGDEILPFALVEGTRGYIERVVRQVNACYRHECYDACAVMARRLVETLIVEAYEHHKIDSKIKNQAGDFLHLRELVPLALNEPRWNLGRNTKKALPKLKDLGDRSAHGRRFNAHRDDVDKIASDLRTVVQEFLAIAGLK